MHVCIDRNGFGPSGDDWRVVCVNGHSSSYSGAHQIYACISLMLLALLVANIKMNTLVDVN